ncbi:NAD(P)/FAD-dependent oxidoreductase [Oceanibium sediminis]|uniref:NAD(P)/FAD-dependent oxidoreductase n=1 Tax=Oceanibium sediminis TaxID=2026339 RepID=UPI001E4D8071|nr:FAD-binding oxidoreductase [Oceanibium sediminis]
MTPLAHDVQHPLWRDTAPAGEDHPPLSGDHRADVTVIGAGFTGLRAALMLAEAGTRVIVLDAGDVGYGASGRTGGQVNPMLPFNTPNRLRALLGPVYFERLAQTSLGSADELFALIERYRIDCQPRQNGWLRVLHSPRALKEARAGMAAWNAFGAGMEEVDGATLAKLSGTTAYRAGVLTPRGGAVQPLALARGLAEAAKSRGAAIHGQSAVTTLERRDGAWHVRTARGAVTSDWVIVATNGYTGGLIPTLPRSILPVTPAQIATDPLPDEVISSILPGGHTISDSRRIIMYARREPDGRMIFGGLGQRGRDGRVGGFDWLARDAARVFPQLAQVRWRYRWSGVIALTDDHLPHLHEPEPGLLAGLGYNGRGVAMANVMGRVMAERVLGAAPETLPFPLSPIRAMPLRGARIAGMGSAIKVLRLLDRLETRPG